MKKRKTVQTQRKDIVKSIYLFAKENKVDFGELLINIAMQPYSLNRLDYKRAFHASIAAMLFLRNPEKYVLDYEIGGIE